VRQAARSQGQALIRQEEVSVSKREAIRRVIEEGYIQGIHEEQDAAKVEWGFHPEFRMLVRKDAEIAKVSPEAFLEMMIGRRRDNPASFKEPLSFETPLIDIEGSAAIVRVEISRGGKHLFTDFILLYKFGEDWKIVSKIFHAHA
jgi:hypothetical protein